VCAQGASSSSTSLDPSGSNATEILRRLERDRTTARVRFESQLGVGEVDVVDGKVVDAYLGELLGRPALMGLLGLQEVTFQVAEQPLEPRPALATSIDGLIDEREQRIATWRKLCEDAPPLTAVLALTTDGRKALDDRQLPRTERALLALFDGQRSVTEIIDESGVDPMDALRATIAVMRRKLGVVETNPVRRSDVPPAPLAARTPEARASLRKHTVVGLGIPPATPAPRAAVHRIIDLGQPRPSAVPAPTPVAPRGRARRDSRAVPSSRSAGGDPRFVARYEVLTRIGHGGMGTVYLCRLNSEVGFRRLFALKILRRHLIDDELAAQKFLEEARLSGAMHHPNVVSVLDAGFDGSQPYLVMDYVEGASLKQLLSADTERRPPELILPVMLDALAGLQAVHTLQGDDGKPLNVVHCDISPENLLVGLDGACRLADFGVARQGTNHVRGQTAIGKPSYMAPEQVVGNRIDCRADLFAFGAMLYGALSGVKLFEADTVEETLRRVCTAPIEPPSHVGLRSPPSLDFVCMKALERDPNRRFSSAQEMFMELRQVALRDNLLAPASMVAEWVRQTVGPDLAQRRLMVLDRPRSRTANAAAEPMQRHEPIERRLGSEPPPLDLHSMSQTMVLTTGDPSRRWGIIVAAALAALAVLVTLLWPSGVSRLFHVKIDAYEGDLGDSAGRPTPSAAPAAVEPPPPSTGLPAVPSPSSH
jgi:serine/threonine protein kinase